jgi:nucleotide-binding universal stress UspA family protein
MALGGLPMIRGALSKDADLLVIGSRGAGGFTRLIVGSTSAQVSQHAHCPVVIVR